MVRGATGREQDMSPMLVITPLGHVARLKSCNDGRHADVDRPPELNDLICGYSQMLYEERWLQKEGFIEFAIGRLKIEPNLELEELCKTLEL
jgi:hypothetical protein